MRFLSAHTIHPVSSPALKDHVLVVEDGGKVADLLPTSELDPSKIEQFEGALVPGFVNVHCHLELSHLRGKFPEKTGLPDFLDHVVSQREADADEVEEAIRIADREMWDNGIAAVGDICNKADSFLTKSQSKIHYHSFIELLGFDPLRAEKVFNEGVKLFEQLNTLGLSGSLVPHAPYSVSPGLLRRIGQHCREQGVPTSIHMMESNDETEFFVQGTGLYSRFYHRLGLDIDFFEPTGTTSLEAMLPHLLPDIATLLVHNTIATTTDVEQASNSHHNLWWCFCPNANLYIEDRLPDVPQLTTAIAPDRVTLGTDSLASNHGLSIWQEIRAIMEAFPEISLETILPWASLNGAHYLGLEQTLGSLEPGKRPGVLHLDHDTVNRII